MPGRFHRSHPIAQIAAKVAVVLLSVSLTGGAGLGQVVDIAFGTGTPTCCCLRMGKRCRCPHCRHGGHSTAPSDHPIVEVDPCAGKTGVSSVAAQLDRLLPRPVDGRRVGATHLLRTGAPPAFASRLGTPPPRPPPRLESRLFV